MVRFIHAADLHLDRPFDGLTQLPETIRQRAADSTFSALTRLIDAVLREDPDFLIISGDIFDNNHRSIKAQRLFVREMNRLRAASIPVYLVYGNHDHVNREWGHLRMPDHVHVFPEMPSVFSVTCADGQVVNLYGFSYHQRWIHEDRVLQYHKRGHADYHIAILHGEIRNESAEGHYAPFLIRELDESGFDYWALGHIHKRQQLPSSVPAWYPGNLQGLSFKTSELGAKGASLVELDHDGAQVQFLPTAELEWAQTSLGFSGPVSADQLERALTSFKEKERMQHKGAFIRIDLSFADPGIPGFKVEEIVQELVDALNGDEEEMDDFIWLIPGAVTFRTSWDKQQVLSSPHFLGDLFRFIEKPGSVNQASDLLYMHRIGRNYLDPLNGEDQEEIRRKSEQLLADALIGQQLENNE